ncbi:hypothetical protein BLS_004026, partial [Venturia inaequalis]
MKLALLLCTAALALASDLRRAAAPYCPGRPVSSKEQLCILKDFLRLVYVKKDVRTAFQAHVTENYIQHTPSFKSGRQATQEALTKYVSMFNFTLAKLSLSDNIAFLMTKQTSPEQEAEGKGMYTVLIDVWRMDGTCLMEHWDAGQAKPADSVNPGVM